eukprot:g2998.t1
MFWQGSDKHLRESVNNRPIVAPHLRAISKYTALKELDACVFMRDYRSRVRFWRHKLDPQNRGRITQMQFLKTMRQQKDVSQMNVMKLWEMLTTVTVRDENKNAASSAFPLNSAAPGTSGASQQTQTDDARESDDRFGDDYLYLSDWACDGSFTLLCNFLFAVCMHFRGMSQSAVLDTVWKAITVDKERESVDRQFTCVSEVALGRLIASMRSVEEKGLAVDQKRRQRLYLELTRHCKNAEVQALMFEDLRWLLFDFPKGQRGNMFGEDDLYRKGLRVPLPKTVVVPHAKVGEQPRENLHQHFTVDDLDEYRRLHDIRHKMTADSGMGGTGGEAFSKQKLAYLERVANVDRLSSLSTSLRLQKKIADRRARCKVLQKIAESKVPEFSYNDVRTIQDCVSNLTRGCRTVTPKERLVKLKQLGDFLLPLERCLRSLQDVKRGVMGDAFAADVQAGKISCFAEVEESERGFLPKELWLLETTYAKAILDIEQEIEWELKTAAIE